MKIARLPLPVILLLFEFVQFSSEYLIRSKKGMKRKGIRWFAEYHACPRMS